MEPTTVDTMVIMFKTNVRRRYRAIRGMVDEVGGRILETRRRKTTKARRMLIASVIFSLASAGR